MDELEVADYEILQRVYRTFVAPRVEKKPNETQEDYQRRMKEEVDHWELKLQYLALLKKSRKVIGF